MSNISFQGTSGHIRMSQGQAIGNPYEVLNVFGKMYRRIGFMVMSQKVDNLSQVLWPGERISVPRGFVESSDEKKFRIAVPVRLDFEDFVSNQRRSDGRGFEITGGFVIDVFNMALQHLPYAFPYEFIPIGNGNVTPDYNNIVYSVHNKEYDAAVGDFTITANRSEVVDFTQEYLESGLAMVVQVKNVEIGNFFIFVQPFNKYLWLAAGSLSLFIALLIWFLEHKYNDAFRGETAEQFVTSLWFTFSTLYFAHREKIETSLGRVVMVFWLFLVLILTSNYTASLTSMLTVQEMEPKVKNLNALKAGRGNVGYPDGSFVKDYLVNELKINEKKLIGYTSAKEYNEAFSNGSIVALFAELPYVRVFLSQYCGYQIVSPTYRTGGFGFVFPKGSPMVSDMSKAILEVSEGPGMLKLEIKWFNNTVVDCSNQGSRFKGLGIDNFWMLFVIAAFPSLLGLCIHRARSLQRHNKVVGSMERIDEDAVVIERASTFPMRWRSFERLGREV